MEIKEYINSFANQICACGKAHRCDIAHIVAERGAIGKLPALIAEYRAKKVFLLADANTDRAAGLAVCGALDHASIAYSKYVFDTEALEPNEKAMGNALMHYDNACDLIVAVGSGVINDIGKLLASVAGKPYFIVATAPSMDGYASATSSMTRDGLKISLPSKCADVIVGDIDVLKQAPMHMLQAGLGDMLAKYVSIGEWRLAHEIVDEYYCPRVADLVRTALKRCVDHAEGLLRREENAVKAVFEGLVICGVAMSFAGMSRPASGSEHYFSHVWDMRGAAFGTPVELHGLQCAVATRTVAELYERLSAQTPNRHQALAYVDQFSYADWSRRLKEFLGNGADAMIALEAKERKYDKEKHTKRLEIILQKWDTLLAIIQEEIPTEQEIVHILDQIGAPKTALDLGIDCDMVTTFHATKDIRDKYVLSRLLWDLGLIEQIKNVR